MNAKQKISEYLGDMSPDQFESIEQIHQYFSRENVEWMGFDFDEEESQMVMSAVIDEFEQCA